jgi:hypothetical protein
LCCSWGAALAAGAADPAFGGSPGPEAAAAGECELVRLAGEVKPPARFAEYTPDFPVVNQSISFHWWGKGGLVEHRDTIEVAFIVRRGEWADNPENGRGNGKITRYTLRVDPLWGYVLERRTQWRRDEPPVRISTSHAHSGQRWLEADGTTAERFVNFRFFPRDRAHTRFLPNQRYRLECWVKVEGEETEAFIIPTPSLGVTPQGLLEGQGIGHARTESVRAGEGWRNVAVEFVGQPHGNPMNVQFIVIGAGKGYFDDFQLWRTDGSAGDGTRLGRTERMRAVPVTNPAAPIALQNQGKGVGRLFVDALCRCSCPSGRRRR